MPAAGLLFRPLLAGVALFASASPAFAELPGALQPGAEQVPPGNLLVLRAVPPRNAIIPGAGAAVTAPTAPPAGAFAGIAGITRVLSDNEAASITSHLPTANGGQLVRFGIDETLRQQPSLAAGATERASGSGGVGGMINGAVQTGLGALKTGLGSLGGGGG